MDLSPEQLDAIRNPARCLLIVACAGSGKTEVLARRIVRRLEEGERPESIIAFTFTEKAAAELKDRIEQRHAEVQGHPQDLPPTCRGMFVGTIHSYCLNLLQQAGGRYGCYDALSDEREWSLLLRVARRLGVVELFATAHGRGADKVATAPAVDAFLTSVEVVRNERIPQAVLVREAPQFGEAMARYEALLDEMRLVSFGTMITQACDGLAPGGPMRRSLEGKVRHVFVDEYQDLNRAQEELLQGFRGMGATITAVGDDDQAIYQWRGGDVALIREFRRRYPQAVVCPLPENRRSRSPIVEVAKTVIGVLPEKERSPKSMSAHREDPSPAVEFLPADTADHEVRFIVDRVEGFLRNGHRPGEIGILFRSVKTSAGPFVSELRRRGIPVRVSGNLPSEERLETRLLTSLFVYWAGGTWYPGASRTSETVTRSHVEGLIREVCDVSPGESATAFGKLERIAECVKREGLFDLVSLTYEILETLGLPSGADSIEQELALGQYTNLLTGFEHAQRRAMRRDFFHGGEAPEEQKEDDETGQAAEEAERGGKVVLGERQAEYVLRRLRSFLEHYGAPAWEEQLPGVTKSADRVHVSTVHQAKGLEFPIVFVPCLVQRRFPSSLTGQEKSWYVPDQLFDRRRYEGRLEDERRLFYVALTRAKELLVLSAFGAYERKAATPSEFLKQILNHRDMKRWGEGVCRPSAVREEETSLETTCGSLLDYEDCGLGYWLREVCGFQPPIAGELGFGRMLHHAVAELARQALRGSRPQERDVERILQESFYLPFAGPIARRKLRESLANRTTAYLKTFGPELTRALAVEVPFDIPLAGARVSGRIDLMLALEQGGKRDVALVDFKTTATRPPLDTHENQLRLYAEAVRALGYNPVEISIHDLDRRGGHRDSVPRDAKSYGDFRRGLEAHVDGIRQGRFRPTSNRKKCANCDFRRICRREARCG